jgi:hypothetical protein
MISYRTDSHILEYYDGTNWSSVSTSSPTSYGFSAGKNKIINGDFGIWQRGTSFSSPASGSYTADRFICYYDGTGATRTLSQQSFTPGTAPVAGYESAFFFRYAQSVVGTQTYTVVANRIEDVRTFAGQTVTVSFWAKSATAAGITGVALVQNFGTGGSSAVTTYSASAPTLTTSWARYSAVISVPSITGKTIGANNNYLEFQLSMALAVATVDIWGIQVEAGSVATAFQTATGTVQGELAACQRYYYVVGGTANQYPIISANLAATSSQIRTPIKFAQTMRVAPTITKNGTWNVSANTTQPAAVFIGTDGFSIEISSSSGAVPAAYAYPDSSDDSFTCSAEL